MQAREVWPPEPGSPPISCVNWVTLLPQPLLLAAEGDLVGVWSYPFYPKPETTWGCGTPERHRPRHGPGGQGELSSPTLVPTWGAWTKRASPQPEGRVGARGVGARAVGAADDCPRSDQTRIPALPQGHHQALLQPPHSGGTQERPGGGACQGQDALVREGCEGDPQRGLGLGRAHILERNPAGHTGTTRGSVWAQTTHQVAQSRVPGPRASGTQLLKRKGCH